MKILKTHLTFLYLFTSMICFAQTALLEKESIYEQMQIHLAKDILEKSTTGKAATDNNVSISKVELVDKDIIIHLNQQPFKNGEYCVVNLEVKLNDQVIEIEPENLFGVVNQKINFTEVPQNHKIVWTNLMEEYIDMKGQLAINLSVDIYGNRDLPYNVDCGVEPSFTRKQKIPFIIAGVLGAGSVAVGQYLKNESEKDYDNYLIQENFDAAEPYYQDANDKANTGELLTNVGIAVLAVDAVWFFIRQRRFKKQMKVYNEFCRPKKVTIQPSV
ncbi:MAG: hypothetical protein AB8F74_17650, partial [Saprospiraceae bacterium]